jgi:hypothetical protein
MFPSNGPRLFHAALIAFMVSANSMRQFCAALAREWFPFILLFSLVLIKAATIAVKVPRSHFPWADYVGLSEGES